MNGSTAELHMFPKHMDRFITWGSEICLYQVKNTEDVDHKTPTSKYLHKTSSKRKYETIFHIITRRYQFVHFPNNYGFVVSHRDSLSIHQMRCSVPSKMWGATSCRWIGKWKSWAM